MLGGAFNPPHIGHLVCAQEALVQLELDRVEFVPFREPPHRALPADPGAEARLEMCELAVADDDRLEVSRIELVRPGPSYTADTLAELRARSPEEEVVLILGGDQAAALPSWHEPERVLSLAIVAAAERTDWPRERIAAAVAGLAGAERIRYFDMPRIDVSSSMVRDRAARGEPIRYLVPDKVAEYIDTHSLYGASTAVVPGPGAD
jgi:nicotinate-nucleotide adenylyltransferase